MCNWSCCDSELRGGGNEIRCAAVAELQTYKDNNKEVETATVLKDAKQHLIDSRKQFSIVRKILNLKCPVKQTRDVIVDL